MGSVGLTFGSATSGQGFDVAATVTQILASEQAIETPWKTQLTTLQAQDTAFTTLGTNLSALTTSLQALTDFSGIFAQKQGSSSNPNILTLTGASPLATAGSHTIIVSQLAQTSSAYTPAVANATDTLSGNVQIKVGTATPNTITVGSGNNTLATLAASINAASIGATASIISDSTGSRLSIVSNTGGAAGQLTIGGSLLDVTAPASLGFTAGQTGQDAHLSVDGIALTSASNTVSNAIAGVSFQLLSSNSGSPVQVQVTNDDAAVETAFSSLVTAYNAVVKNIASQEGKDSSGNAQPLFGNSTLAAVQNQLTQALTGIAPSGSITNLSQLGITSNTDGTLALSTSTLQSALDSHYTDVTGFLQNAGSFGQKFGTALDTIGAQNPQGQVSLALSANSASEKDLNASISSEDLRIAADKSRLTQQLTAADQILQGIPAQLNQVNQIYSAITGYVAAKN